MGGRVDHRSMVSSVKVKTYFRFEFRYLMLRHDSSANLSDRIALETYRQNKIFKHILLWISGTRNCFQADR